MNIPRDELFKEKEVKTSKPTKAHVDRVTDLYNKWHKEISRYCNNLKLKLLPLEETCDLSQETWEKVTKIIYKDITALDNKEEKLYFLAKMTAYDIIRRSHRQKREVMWHTHTITNESVDDNSND